MINPKMFTIIGLALCFNYIYTTQIEILDAESELISDNIAETDENLAILFKPTSSAHMCPVRGCKPSIKTKKFKLQYFLNQLESGDLDTYIQLMCQITGTQRQIVDDLFFQRTGKNLRDTIKMTGPLFTSNLKMALRRLRMKPEEIFAEDINHILHKFSVDIDRLTEILFTISNYGLLLVTDAYGDMFGISLHRDIKKTMWRNPLARNLLALRAENGRKEILEVNEGKAMSDADHIYNNRASKFSSWEAYFNNVIVSDSADQLHLLFDVFENKYGSIKHFITQYAKASIKKVYINIVSMTRDPYEYLARRLFNTMKGLGTKDRDLMRIIIGRGEIDLASIEDAFDHLPEAKQKGKNLRRMIKSDTHLSRHYQHILTYILSSRATK